MKGINYLKTFLVAFLICKCIISLQAQDLVWVKDIKGASTEITTTITQDPWGNTYHVGYFNSTTLKSNPGDTADNLSRIGNFDIYLIKYDSIGNFIWSKGIGGAGADQVSGVGTDLLGRIYITGHFSSTVDFNPGKDGGEVTSVGGTDIFLAQYDSSGNFLWVKAMGAAFLDYSFGLTVDKSGNVYIIGTFVGDTPAGGNANFNRDGTGGVITSHGANDIFLAKYDENGNYLWAINMGGAYADRGHAVCVDKAGYVYVTGYFAGTAKFSKDGAITLVAKGGSDVFLAKYDSNSNCMWAKNMGGNAEDIGNGIAADEFTNVYVTGHFNASADFSFGNAMPLVAQSADMFLAKYDSSGNYLWAHGIGAEGGESGKSVSVDLKGNVCLVGGFSSNVDFDPGADTAMLYSEGDLDVVVAKYSTEGHYIWARNIGGEGTDDGTGSWVDKHGNVYATGWYNKSANFNIGVDSSKIFTSDGRSDAFVVKYGCNSASFDSLYIVECGDSYLFNEVAYTSSGVYIHSFQNVYGCDSIVALNLTFKEVRPVISVSDFKLSVSNTYMAYQWLLNEQLIAGATEATYIVEGNGSYSVEVTDSFGCEGVSAPYLVNNAAVGNVNNAVISIFPNPAQEVVTILSAQEVVVSVSDVSGHILGKHTQGQISLQGMASGVYLFKVFDQSGNLLKVEKVIKQ